MIIIALWTSGGGSGLAFSDTAATPFEPLK